MTNELIIRPAQPADRPAMERVCAQTWDWGDYVPDAWDEWLADPKGGLTVGEVDAGPPPRDPESREGGEGGLVVAVSKITFQPDGQVWLEGMRVDPDHRRQGIASRFLDYNLDEARRRGARVVRLGTGSHNEAVHKMVARAGMTRIGRYVLWAAEPLAEAPPPAFLTPAQAAQARAFLADSPALAHAHGLYCLHWAWQALSAGRVAEFLAAGQVAGQFDGQGALAALATAHLDPEDADLWLGFVDGQAAAVTALARALRGHAAQTGAERVRVMLPDLPRLREALAAAGYGFGDWEGELWIFERWLRPGAGGGDDR